MCNQNEVEQRELVALTQQEQRLLRAAPELLEACLWATQQSHHLDCRIRKNSAGKCDCFIGAARHAIAKAESNE